MCGVMSYNSKKKTQNKKTLRQCSFIEYSVVFAILLSSNIFVYTKKRHKKKDRTEPIGNTGIKSIFASTYCAHVTSTANSTLLPHYEYRNIKKKKKHTSLMLIAINRICCTHNGTSLSVLCIVSGTLLSHRSMRC